MGPTAHVPLHLQGDAHKLLEDAQRIHPRYHGKAAIPEIVSSAQKLTAPRYV